MRFTKHVIAAIAALAGSTLVLADPYDHAYWAQYASGDPEICVQDALDLGPEVVYEGDIAGSKVRIEWNGSLLVYTNGVPLPNLTVGEDAFGRPAFSQNSNSGMSGFLDLDEDGRTFIHLRGFSQSSVRIIMEDSLTSDDVRSAAKCNCFGTGTGGTITTCTDSNCDTAESCQTGGTGQRHCRWSAASTGDLAELTAP